MRAANPGTDGPVCIDPGERPDVTRLVASLVCGIGLLVFLHSAFAQSGASKLPNNVQRTDVMALPQFCWGYFIPEMRTPEYMIPRSCGPYTNHYCEAVLPYNRAKIRGTMGPARETATRDLHQKTLGFLQNIKPHPDCPAQIKAYAESLLAETGAKLGQVAKPAR